MEERSPEKSSRIERRGRNSRHKETPYARKPKKTQKNEEEVIENGTQNRGLLGFAFGKVMNFVSSVVNFTTYTPRNQDSSDSSGDEQMEEPKQVIKTVETPSQKPQIVQSNEDSIANAIKTNSKGITQSEYQFYLELLRQKRTDKEETKKEEKPVNETPLPTQPVTSNVLRPQAIHPPNATTVDILRPFMQRSGRTNLGTPSTPSTSSQLQARQPLKRPISPPKSLNMSQGPSSIRNSRDEKQEGEISFLTTQPPAKRQYREGSLGVSETAKRILDALDQFSSPVTEVKTPSFLHVGQNRGLTSARSLNISAQNALTPKEKLEKSQMKTPAKTPVSAQEIPPSQSLTSVAPLTSAKKPKVVPKATPAPTPEREVVELDDESELHRKEKKVDITQRKGKTAEVVPSPRELDSEKQLQEQLKKVPVLPVANISFNFTPKPAEKTQPVDDKKDKMEEEKKPQDTSMFFQEIAKESKKKKREVEEIEEEDMSEAPKAKESFKLAEKQIPKDDHKETPKETPKEAPKEKEAPSTAFPSFPAFPTFTAPKIAPKVDVVSSWKPSNKFAALADEEPQEVFAPGADDDDEENSSGTDLDSDSDSDKKSKSKSKKKEKDNSSSVGGFKFDFPPQSTAISFNTEITPSIFGQKKDTKVEAPDFSFNFSKKVEESEATKAPSSIFFTEESSKEKPKEEKKVDEIKFGFSAASTTPTSTFGAFGSTPFGETKKETIVEPEKSTPTATSLFGASFPKVETPKESTPVSSFNFGATNTPIAEKKDVAPLLTTTAFSNPVTTPTSSSTPTFLFTGSTAPTTSFAPTSAPFGTSSRESNSGFTFGAPTSTPSPFGTSTSTFGTSASTSNDFVFGATPSTPSSSSTTTGMDASPFKGFSASSTSTAPSTSTFGSSTFGSSSFGTNLFGNTASTPSTGFGTSTATSMGTEPFGNNTTSTFGSSPFGNAPSTSFTGFGSTPFGGSSTPSTSTFSGFGAPSTAPSTGNDFVFGGSSTAPTSTGLFQSTPATNTFGTSPFGGGFPAATPASNFTFGSAPTSFGGPAPSPFGNDPTNYGGGAPSGFSIGASSDSGRKKLKAKRSSKK